MRAHDSSLTALRLLAAIVLSAAAMAATADGNNGNNGCGYPLYGGNALVIGNNSTVNGFNIGGGEGRGNAVNPANGNLVDARVGFSALNPPSFPTFSGGANYNGAADAMPPGTYGSVTLTSGTLAAGTYYINSLTIGNNVALTVGGGTLYINTVSIGNSNTLSLTAATQFAIGSSFIAGNNVTFQGTGSAASSARAWFYLYNAASWIGGNSGSLFGFVIAPGSGTSISIGNNWAITGGLISANAVIIGNNNAFTFGAADSAALGGGSGNCPGGGGSTAPSSFNAVETGQSAGTGRLYTKLAGAGFSFDVYALKADGVSTQTTYTGPAKIELVDGSCGAGTTTACKSCAAYQTVSASQAFVAGKYSATGVVVANAYANLRWRITDTASPATLYACSADNFSVRPSAVTLSTTANATAPALGSPAIKAGAAFTLGASASPSGYAGSLVLDTSKLTAQLPSQVSTQQAGGTVGALSPATLVANATQSGNASYAEVGYLYLGAGAFRDDALTAVDQAGGDCITYGADPVNYLSDTLVNGKYGCSIGNKTAVSLGRFIPDHFTVTPGTLTPGCGASFTYFGQGLSTQFTITAQASGGATTTNYSGALARLPLASWSGFVFSASGAPTGLGYQSGASAPSGAWSSGSAVVTATHLLAVPATSTPPTNVTFNAAPVDADGVTTAGTAAVNSPAAVYDQGRARMLNAIGPETFDLPLPFRTEYWQSNAAGWQLNTADTCTAATVQLGSGTLSAALTCVQDSGNPGASGAGCTAASSVTGRRYLKSGVSGVDAYGNAGFAGNFNLWLKAVGAGNLGTVLVSAQVPAWLQYNWSGTVGNPGATATFGLNKPGPVIYRMEHFN